MGSFFGLWTLVEVSSSPSSVEVILRLQQILAVLVFPGLLIGMIASGNVHGEVFWVAVLGNFAVYFGLAYALGSFLERRKNRESVN